VDTNAFDPGELPPLENLTNLVILEAFDCNLVGDFPTCFGRMSKLRYLTSLTTHSQEPFPQEFGGSPI